MTTSPTTSPGFESCGTLYLMTVLVLTQGLRENANWQKKANRAAPAAAVAFCLFEWFECSAEGGCFVCAWCSIGTRSLDEEDECLHYLKYWYFLIRDILCNLEKLDESRLHSHESWSRLRINFLGHVHPIWSFGLVCNEEYLVHEWACLCVG